MKKKRIALLHSVIALLLCVSMLAGTTFAWFTDSVQSGSNRIVAGNLDVGLDWWDGAKWAPVDQNTNVFEENTLWEPGHTEVVYLRVSNLGTLALKYQLGVNIAAEAGSVNVDGEPFVLSDYIQFDAIEDVDTPYGDRDAARAAVKAPKILSTGYTKDGTMLAGAAPKYVAFVVYMPETVDNKANYRTGEQPPRIDLGISLFATQFTSESDSFGSDYDYAAGFPEVALPDGGKADVEVSNGTTAANVTISGNAVSAEVPAGVAVNDGTTALELSVTSMETTGSNITASENEVLKPVNVHVEGVSATNTQPITVTLKGFAAIGLNEGNLKLFHVENGETNAMIRVASVADFNAHNQFVYDPATGDVTLHMATFSEVAMVANTVNAWEGNFDYSWYVGRSGDYTIANADQLAAFGAIVGGMNGQTQDSFSGKTIKLVSDVNLGDKESENNADLIFYPIGYYNSTGKYVKASGGSVTSNVHSFEGTFDGNGHTIKNFYQNTWEMFGDYNSGYSGTPNHYKDAMGLFGHVHGGTVRNLTVDSFSSDGEFTPTGVITAYADGKATFKNIAITNCNPRVYNTGNGGIIGIAGDTGTVNDDHITLKNITVDNSNKISALWGSWDVACGGLVGMYRGNVDGSGKATGDTISFTNCHVAAQIDVYNDVCANYQYYAYRYAGMIIGSVRHNTTNTDGKTIPAMDGISASGCTVNYGDWNDYYYCEFEKNSMASYSEDYQFSRVPHSELNFTDSNGNGVVDADERAFVTGCKHTHTAEENHQAIYLPFHQLFTGYSWGVSSIGLEQYSGIVTNLDITEGDQEGSAVKFESKFTGDFLYRVGNQNAVSVGDLFAAKDGETINSSGVVVSIDKVDENSNVSGTFTANTDDWTKGTIRFSGTGVVKLTIQDYNFCAPTVLIVEVVDATNLTEATGTTSGGNFVLLCDVNASDYVYYYNATLYGNGFTYSLNGAPTAYSSSHGHGVIITKNATLDNLKIIGDVYEAYGAYTNQDYYNAAVDISGDTVIQNCYISGCSAPVNVRSNVTIKNTTLYGGAVANLMIKSGTVTLEDVTTANYADGRALVGMGIVAHSDVSESAKLIINGTLKQHNFINENNIPSDSSAKILYNAMFDDACSQYHFDTDEGKYVNTGVISMSALFNASDITDNANTGYVGSTVSVNSVNGYVYTQPNTSGSVDNSYSEEDYSSTTQGAVPPTITFDHTINEAAKTDGSNDYCYEESGTVYISMDVGDSVDWDTSIATITKQGNMLDYTVTMNGVDYTGKTITFDTAGDYIVWYTYTDGYNSKVDEDGSVTTYEVTYAKTISINVSVIKPTTKHAEFTFGSAGTASTSTTIGNNTYIMPNVTATSATVGSITVSGKTIYYPIVDAYTSDGETAHSSLNSWYMCYPVFKNVISITDYESGGTGNAVTYGSSTTTMPSGLSLTAYSQYFSQTTAPSGAVSFTSGGADVAFKYQASNSASSTPTTLSNVLIYASPTLSNNARNEMYLLVQYKYQDNAGATYYYYVGYHMPQTTESTACVTSDTLVTMADGSQKRVEELNIGDMVLAFSHESGKFVPTPVIFNSHVDNMEPEEYDVINLVFSNGEELEIVGSHGLFDMTLMKYVYLDYDNYTDFIGHKFFYAGADGTSSEHITLVKGYIETKVTRIFCPVTYFNMNSIANGFLNAPNSPYGIAGPVNYFDYDPNLKYNEEAMQRDIEKYGLYTYDDFREYISEEAYNSSTAVYLKIAEAKGLVTFEEILIVIEYLLEGSLIQ